MSITTSNPSGWTTVRLGDVGQWYGGGTPSKFEPRFWTDGTIPWVSPKDMKSSRIIDSEDHLSQSAIDETNVREFPRGTVLLVIRSGILSRTLPVGVAEVSGTMNQDLKGVRTAKGIDPMFLAYQLIGREREVLNKCSKHGTTVASIDTERLHDFEIRLAPTPEQRRIVAKIEELFSDLDAGVAALERVRANLKRYRAAVLKAAVEGHLTEEWRKQHPATEPAAKLLERILAERRAKWEQDQLRKFKEAGKTPPKGWKEKYEEPPRPKDIDASSLPSTWCWATIDQLIAGDRSSAYGVLQPGDDVPDGVPLVRVCDVADGRVAVDQLKRIAPEIAAQFARTVLRGGEVLLTIVGTIGRTAVAPESLRGANTARAVAVLPVSDLVPARFVELMLRDSTARAKLTLAAHEVARKTLNLEDVRIACVPVAPPAEQAEIVAEVDRRLSVADAAETQVEHALQRAARLRQAILKRAFEGKLVPQDPTDEPAATFLEPAKASGNGHRADIETSSEPRPTPTKRRSRARA